MPTGRSRTDLVRVFAFEVRRRDLPERAVAAALVVPTFDIGEQRQPCFGLSLPAAPVDQLALERGEEALGHGVVVSVAYGSHRGSDVHLLAPVAEGDRGVLGEFNPWSQHFQIGGVDGREEERIRVGETNEFAISGTTACAASIAPRAVLASHSQGLFQRRCCSAGRVVEAVGTRWFRECGGMPASHLAVSALEPTGRYLSFAEREQIALARARGDGVRKIARQLERAASTISRELRRNAAIRSGGFQYRAMTAQWHADRSARRPKPVKMQVNPALWAYVQDRLAGNIATPGGRTVLSQ